MTTRLDVTPPNTAPRKRHWIVPLLLPVSFVMFGRAYLVAAHSQQAVPAHVVLSRDTPVAPKHADRREQPALELRSLSHPFPAVSENRASILTFYTPGYGSFLPSVPVAAGEKAVWFSGGVNQIHSSLLLPNVTWLGTEVGLKRLDNRTRTVQHFCALDGLPYNRITAIAGQEQQLFCSAEQITFADPRPFPDGSRPHRSVVALCRYHAESGKWEPVAEENRDYPQGVHVSPPEQAKAQNPPFAHEHAEQEFVTVGGDHACLVLGPGLPGQALALASPVKGGDAAKILCPSFANRPFHLSFAHADAESLWVGSDLGLLRYDFKARQWERLLPDLVVTGGCPAEPGSLWLLTQRFDPAHSDRDGFKFQTEHWQITHFVPGKAPEHFALTDHENRENVSADTISFSNIVASGDKVWTTQQRFLMGGNLEFSECPAVYALNLSTRTVALEAPFASDERQYAAVPDALLAKALNGWHALVPLVMSARFPGWICSSEDKDAPQPAIALSNAYSGTDDAGDRWYTQGEWSNGPKGNVWRVSLKQVSSRGEECARYELPPFPIKTHEPVSSPVILGEKVYFLSQAASVRLYSWDRKTDQVVPVPEMDAALTEYKPEWGGSCRLMSDGESLWVGTGWAVLRYNLKTKQVDAWKGDKAQAGSWAYPYPLLSVEGGKAWIKGAPNRLLTAGDPTTSAQMVPVALPPFPAEVEQDQAEAVLFAKQDGIVWFKTKSAAIPRHPVLIGYRMQARTWTTPYAGALSLLSAAETTSIVKQGPIQWFYGSYCALGFNTATGQWQALPPIPMEMQAFYPTLTSVDAQNAWALSDSKLLHLDRIRNIWAEAEAPFYSPPFEAPPSLRAGNALLVPTRSGLWTIDLTTQKGRQAPAIDSPEGKGTNNFSVAAVDRNAVWMIGSRSGDGFLIRFDRRAHAWNTIPAQEGVSMSQPNTQWSADGESCWLRTPKDTYRLNIKTNRWENISARLAGNQGKLAFQQIVPDGDDVWLVAAVRDARNAPLPHPAAVPLYRYHVKTDTFVPVQPNSGKPLLSHLLTVNRDSVLLSTAEGNFRFDRATNRWNPVLPPALPVGIPLLKTLALYEEAGSYWFVGTDNSLHLTK